jgi:oligoribonuclease NrnB/cAMP/cGMP phosphodiesterase (DHH superfamily)
MITCIYHQECMDGFGAAWVVSKKFRGQEIEFISARYGDSPPRIFDSSDDVIIVDFSYPRDTLLKINETAYSLLVLDHHKTAQANCDGLDFAEFDINKSGVMMAWEHFFPQKNPPEFLKYIQDRDLWQWKLPYSKEINAALYSYPMDFEVWDDLQFRLFGTRGSDLVEEGRAILRDRQKTIDSLVSGWAIERLRIGGYDVPCLNCPRWLASDVLNILAKGEPFAISYFDSADGRTFELRSTENGVDVSEIARQYGGGGHKHAAGFKMGKPKIL